MSNEGATLLISEVVRREIEAKFRSERSVVARELAKLIRRMGDFQVSPSTTEPQAQDDTYDFTAVLARRFEKVVLVPFELVPHSELVTRAISVTRPFRDGEKGYRDTLIWLSLLQYLKQLPRSPQRLFFINNNLNDFFEKDADGVKLHPHLWADWKSSGLDTELIPYLSLKDFVDKEVDPVLHSIRHEKFEDECGSEMESIAAEIAVEFLQEMSLSQMQEFLEAAGVSRRCSRQIRNFSVEDFEGVEDPEVLSLSSLKDGSLYIRYSFNLLTVIYTVEVSTEDYLSNAGDFDEEFINVQIDDRLTRMNLFRRCDFEASFSYRQSSEEFTSASIDFAEPRPTANYRWMPRVDGATAR